MKRTFEFNDDKSNKFWSIEPNEKEFTVIFGKTGTSGQSQTKTFRNEELCQKEVRKLIAEKQKKGYVETAESFAAQKAIVAERLTAKVKTMNDNPLPKNYREVIAGKPKMTDELRAEGFSATVGAGDIYEVFVYVDAKGNPFLIRVWNNNGVWDYDLTINLSRCYPLFKYIFAWGRENRKGELINLAYYFAEYLLEKIGDYDEEKDGFYAEASDYYCRISLKTTNEESFLRLIKETAAAFCRLAEEHSGIEEDNFDNYKPKSFANLKEKELKEIPYADLTDNMLILMLSEALRDGADKFRKSRHTEEYGGENKDEMHNEFEGEFDEKADRNVSIRLDQQRKSLQLYTGKNCSGKVFFEFKLGDILPKCISMANEQGLDFQQEQLRWLNEAINLLPNLYRNKRVIIINVHEI
jgi:predicted DNA-binding WGR domain protein